MRPVHWIRSRQEECELRYWLSLVSYDHRDHSFVNRIYLLYLILFFSIWIFAVLTIFASGGAALLRLLNPVDPFEAAIFLEVFLVGIWSVFTFWQSLKRSPIVFSEQDAMLICQTPVSRRHITSRWFLMPWFKSAVLFWLVAITLGFSVAEITLPGAMDFSRILEYTGFGLHAWIAIVPIHLTLFLLSWVIGIIRLQKNIERGWLIWLVIPATIVLFSFLLICIAVVNPPFLTHFSESIRSFLFPLQAGSENGVFGVSLFINGLLTTAIFGVMVWVSGTFNLSRAVQETQEIELINSSNQYGFKSQAENIKTRQRLGVRGVPARLPVFTGAETLVWKDLLQSVRTFRLATLFVWLRIFLFMFVLPLLPDLGSRVFIIIIWTIQVGQVSANRIRSDLSLWPVTRQLPISHKKFILYELSPACLLSVITSFAGFVISSIIFKASVDWIVALIPGIIAGIAGIMAFNVIRRSGSGLLLNGSVPEVSAGGILLGVICAVIPVLIYYLSTGFLGLFLSILLSLGLGFLAFHLAVRSYRVMGNS